MLDSGVVIASGDTLIEVEGLPSPILVRFGGPAGYAPGPASTASLPGDLAEGWMGDLVAEFATGDVGGRPTAIQLIATAWRPGMCLLNWTATQG